MNKYFHGFLMGVSVLPALAIMPAMAVDTNNWKHPEIDSYTTINNDINFVVDGGTYNVITGTAMRNIVNGDVNLTVKNVTQEAFASDGLSDGIHGVLFIGNSGGSKSVNVEKYIGRTQTAAEEEAQAYVNGDINVTVIDSNVQNNVIGVNFFSDHSDITTDGALSGKTTVTVDNSVVGLSVRGTNYFSSATNVPNAKIGDLEININNSLIKDEVVSAGSAASAGNVVINVTGNSVIGYTAADSDTPTSALTDGGWIIAGANRTGATVASTEVNLNTSGTIRIAGDVHAGSRQRASAPDTDENSVIGNATLNMLGGGNINIGGDVRAYHVGGATELNINNVDVNVVGTVKEFQTINMDENAKLTAGALVLTANDTLNMTLASADAYSQIDVDTLDANGATLNMTVRGAGTYNVVSANTVTSDFTWNKENAVYTLTEENGTVTAVLKSSSDIAEENGITKETAAAIAGVAQSTSEKLNDLSVKMQEKLAEDTAEAKQEVEKAAAAVHPEKESVAQSIAASVQTTVANLTGARMRMVAPRIGRNGGDVRLTGGGVWAQGLFNKSKQNDAFSGYTRGIAAGMDGTINNAWTIGAGYSYAHSDISGTERDTEIDSNTIFVYGQYKPTQWYVNAMLNYTMSDFSEEGVVMGTPVTGDYDVNSFGGVIATGYDFASGVTPELGLRYMHVMADDYTNSMDVKTKSKDTDFLTGVFGAKYAFGINMDRYTKLIPQLNAAVKYDMLSDRNISTVTMPGVDSYTLRGERLSRLGGEFGIGLGLKYKTLDFSINYDIDVRKDYTSQTGMLKFRYNF